MRDRIVPLEGTSNYLVQLCDNLRADYKMKHVIKGIVEMPLKHWQTWGIDHLSRKPIPVFDHPLSKEIFLTSSLYLPWHSFEPFPHVLSPKTRKKSSATPSPKTQENSFEGAQYPPLEIQVIINLI